MKTTIHQASPIKPTARAVAAALRTVARPEKIAIYQSFFKTGPGQYGEGDRFLGVCVPDTRRAIRPFLELSLPEAQKLIDSPWHEERFAGLLILVAQFERGDARTRRAIFDFYLINARRVNNWDLVDCTTPQIVGGWLVERNAGWGLLRRLARSENLWERRIAVLATFAYIRSKVYTPTLEIAAMLQSDAHDLIHKAVGWMLREVGKRDRATEDTFLDERAAAMPRTMLRYAIEKHAPESRKRYMSLGKAGKQPKTTKIRPKRGSKNKKRG